LQTIYRTILSSSISIEINKTEKIILIKDYKCPLCRYPYGDLSIAGCEIILGMVSEFIALINKDSSESSIITLEPDEVKASKALGHDLCIHVFKYKVGGG
jgi:ribosomal protein L25 (general stress protein Ctc)